MNKKIFGILNITPDSFSDGGHYTSSNNALKQAKYFLSHNIYAIDIGATSTRPSALVVSDDQEVERLKEFLPKIFQIIKSQGNTKFSLDSYNFKTINFAMQYGLNIINDVSGLQDDRFVDLLVSNKNLEIVFMHSLSLPVDKNIIMPQTGYNLIAELANFAAIKIAKMLDRGITLDRIIFDPGIGFGKNASQSLYIIQNIDTLKTNIKSTLGLKNNTKINILIGHSRKSFLKELANFTQLNNNNQNNITLDALTAFTTNTMLQSCDFLRLHKI